MRIANRNVVASIKIAIFSAALALLPANLNAQVFHSETVVTYDQYGQATTYTPTYQTPAFAPTTYPATATPVQSTYQQGAPQYSNYPQGNYATPVEVPQGFVQPQFSGSHSGYSSNSGVASNSTATTHVPTYQGPGVAVGSTRSHQGADYSTNAGVGFDKRVDHFVGGTYDGEKFVGAGGSVGAGLYGDAGASQSGKIGKVDVRNYAEGEAFVGTEADGRIGFTKEGATVGGGAFAGGRVSGTIGSDIGPVGYGATGEAWSGAGIEAGVNAGFDDGVLRFGGEAGIGLGVGGKLGVQGSVDVGAIGDGIVDVGQDVGQWGKKTGQNIGNTAKKVGSNVGNGVKKFGSNVGKETKKVTTNVSKGVKKAGKGISKGFKKIFGK